MNYRFLIQYDGTRYDGWQRQKTTQNTIQGKLEQVLSRMTEVPIEVKGASRTDAGVHARGQVANAHLPEGWTAEEILSYVNQYLPEDIAVLEVKEVSDRFHSRLNAGAKTYLYRVSTNEIRNVFERKYIYPLNQPLDLEAMRNAAQWLVGEHDFQSFCAKKMKKSSVRRLDEIRLEQKRGELRMTFTGSGFLYNMVRILAGTLIEVGLHQRDADTMPELLAKRARAYAGFTAPAKGLTLMKILY